MSVGKKLKNKKGFTLIELIAVIALMGIILVLALPQVSKIQQANKNRKYEAYEMSIERGAKLYTDSNARDMFGNNNSGCVTIPYSVLKSSNVIKDFSDPDITCSNDSETYVRIRKINDDYRYDVALICRQDGEVVYKQEIDTTFTCTNSPDTEVPIIEASPSSKSDWVKPEDLSVTIKISDASGLNKNTSIKYYWVNTAGEKVGKEYTYNYNNKEGVTKVSYKIPKKKVVDVTGEYYLVIEPYRTTTANGVQDVLGNDRVTGEQFGTYKIDNTKPSCSNVDGEKTSWTNTDFTITQYCSDGESGCVKESYSKKFTTSTTTHTFTIKDNAGNTNECKVNVYLDKEKPTCGKVTGESTEWTNKDRTISVKCKEEEYSKCKQDAFEVTFSTEGKTDNIEIEDNAGNTTQCEVNKYIDKTPPKCPTITSSTKAGTWTNKDITYTFKFTSDTAKYIWYTKVGDNDWTDWGENKASVTKKTISSEGYRKVGVRVYDSVGNEQLCGTEATYNIDKSAPSCGTASGSSTTWTNKDRYISQGCNDSLSGCTAASFNKTFTTEGKTGEITISDKVGNTNTCTVNKYIDKTNPTCISSGGSSTETVDAVTIIGTCSDNLSGCTGNVSKTLTSDMNQQVSPGTVKDNAGNETTCPTQQVNINTVPKKPTISNPTNGNWVNYSFALTVSTTSPSKIIGYWQYSYDNNSWTTYANSATNKFTTTNFSVERNQLAYIRVCNKSGVCSESASTYIRIDKTAPSCGSVTGASTTWTNKDRYISQGCNDSGSGCSATSFNKTFTTEGVTDKISISDKAGNTNNCTVNKYIDKTKPTLGYKLTEGTTGATYNSGTWTKYPVYRDLYPADEGGSGVKETQFNDHSDTEGWRHEPNLVWFELLEKDRISEYRVIDNAGNISDIVTVHYLIDQTPPTCVSSGGSSTVTTGSVTIKGTCSDNLSGCTGNVSKTFSSDMNQFVSPGIVKDKAGNETTCPTQQVYISSRPNKPTIYNPTNENWVNYNFALTVKTTTASSDIGYWQYSYDNSSWTTYSNSATNSFVTTDFSQERNQLAYIRVCNKAGLCSEPASTYIRIDKTPPEFDGFEYQYTAPDALCTKGLTNSDTPFMIFQTRVYNVEAHDPEVNGAKSDIEYFTITLSPTYWAHNNDGTVQRLQCTEDSCYDNAKRYKYHYIYNIQRLSNGHYTFPSTQANARVENPYYGSTKAFCVDWCMGVSATDYAGNVKHNRAYGTGTECPIKYNNSEGY